MSTTPDWDALDRRVEDTVAAVHAAEVDKRERERKHRLAVLRAQSGQAQRAVQMLAGQIAGTVRNDLRVARIVAALQLAEELIEKAHAGIGAELSSALSDADRAQAEEAANRG